MEDSTVGIKSFANDVVKKIPHPQIELLEQLKRQQTTVSFAKSITSAIGEKPHYDRNYFLERKIAMLNEYGGVCACCGSREQLEFDHIQPRVVISRFKNIEVFVKYLETHDVQIIDLLVGVDLLSYLSKHARYGIFFKDRIQTMCHICNRSKRRYMRCKIHTPSSESVILGRIADIATLPNVKLSNVKYVKSYVKDQHIDE